MAESKGVYTPRQPPVALTCPQCRCSFSVPAWLYRQREKAGVEPKCSVECARAAKRVHTPETKAAYHAEYRKKNRDWISEKRKAARQGPQRKHILERDRRLYYANIEANRKRARDYARVHKAEASDRQKEWAKKNPDKVYWHIVRSNIAAQIGIKPRMVPDQIVEARIAMLKVRRAVLDAKGCST